MGWQQAMRESLPAVRPRRHPIPRYEWPTITERLLNGAKIADLAREYQVTPYYINRILREKNIVLAEARKERGTKRQSYQRLPVIPIEAHASIAQRVLAGETYQSISEDYDVTRERIRQVALEHGVVSIRKERYDPKILAVVDEVIFRRLQYRPIATIFEELDLPFHHQFFERRLKELDGTLYAEWMLAKESPYSHTGRKTPDGQVCIHCREYCAWDDFYADHTHRGGKGDRCKECAKRIVKEYTDKRHVPEPTVTKKNCPGCDTIQPADNFYRATHQNSGLQTYCIPCQAGYNKKQRST